MYRHVDEDSRDELAGFLLPALHLGRLEIGGSGSFPLPTLFSDAAPCLRELVISRCTPWPSNQFGSLTSLSRRQMDIDSNIDFLNVLRRSLHLEELSIEREFGSSVESRHPQEPKTRAIPLHSLKRLHICRVLAGATRRLLGALDLLPNGISMQFTNVSMEIGAIFPETITPELSPRAATKLELVYPSLGVAIPHATNGIAHTRSVYPCYPGRHHFWWIAGEATQRISLEGTLATYEPVHPFI